MGSLPLPVRTWIATWSAPAARWERRPAAIRRYDATASAASFSCARLWRMARPVPPHHDLVTLLQEAARRVIDAAGADHLRKMRGLYVDYSAGTVLLHENITAAEAHELTTDVQAVLDVATRAWCHDQVRERLGEVQQHEAELADVMASVARAVQTDPDTALSLGCQMLQDGLSNEPPSGG
jgi:hypothetical protein